MRVFVLFVNSVMRVLCVQVCTCIHVWVHVCLYTLMCTCVCVVCFVSVCFGGHVTCMLYVFVCV